MADRVWLLDGGCVGGDTGFWYVAGWLGATDVASESFVASEAASSAIGAGGAGERVVGDTTL